MDLSKILKEYGLSEKQARVYLACLELGSSSVLKISRKSDVPRSTCELILEFLQKKGLVSSFKKKKIRNFSIDDPRKLIDLEKEKITLIERAMPEFLALYGQAKTRPAVRFYQGQQGMKTILEEVLDEADEVLSFSSAVELFDTLITYFPEFVKRRIQKKIPARVILRDSPKAKERQALGRSELREVRIIPPTPQFHASVFIWKNKIAMFSFEKNDLIALLIESQELAQIHRVWFDLFWQTLPTVKRQ